MCTTLVNSFSLDTWLLLGQIHTFRVLQVWFYFNFGKLKVFNLIYNSILFVLILFLLIYWLLYSLVCAKLDSFVVKVGKSRGYAPKILGFSFNTETSRLRKIPKFPPKFTCCSSSCVIWFSISIVLKKVNAPRFNIVGRSCHIFHNTTRFILFVTILSSCRKLRLIFFC